MYSISYYMNILKKFYIILEMGDDEVHILFATVDFVDSVSSPTSGLPKYLFRVSRALIEMGHKVSIVTCSNRSVYYSFFGIDVYRVREKRRVTYPEIEKEVITQCLDYCTIIENKIEEIDQNEKIDIIQYANLYGLAYLHKSNIPSITRVSSYWGVWEKPGFEERNEVLAKMEIEGAKRTNRVIAPSYCVADSFSKDLGSRVDVIETPFILEDSREDNRVYTDILEGKKYILFYGTLVYYKGLTDISEAIYSILDDYKDIFLCLIGDGEYSFIQSIIDHAREYSNRIIYHKGIGFNSLIPIIKNAELVLLPSKMENLSNAAIESMALGQIVVGTRGASFEQLIDDGESGYLCEISNPTSIKNAIDRVMSLNEEQRNRIKKNAIKRIDKLSPDKVVVELINYYEEVIEEGRC